MSGTPCRPCSSAADPGERSHPQRGLARAAGRGWHARRVASRGDPVTPGWRLVHIGFEGDAVEIDGLNPWTVDDWGHSLGRITVARPSYPAQRHDMDRYRFFGPRGMVESAAGEFSNGVWGLYAPS